MNFMVTIYFANGSRDEHRFKSLQTAREFCRNGISDSAVQHVELTDLDSYVNVALWDIGMKSVRPWPFIFGDD